MSGFSMPGVAPFYEAPPYIYKGKRSINIVFKSTSETEQALSVEGAMVVAVNTDVSRVEDVEALAKKTLSAFGAVYLLFNNAGVGAGSSVWETTPNDWACTLDINFWGVLHGVQTFLPIMSAQEGESYIINTSSIAGLLPYHPVAPYQVSKHAVVALSEKLFYDLGENERKIKVSVLYPGWVLTRILEADRNRPSGFQDNLAERKIPRKWKPLRRGGIHPL